MSGIFGIWYLDGRPVGRLEMTRLSETLRHRGPDDRGMRIDGAAGVGCRLARITIESAAEVQPVADATGAMLVFDGRLDNRDELLTALACDPAISPDSPDSVLVLAAYRAFGDDAPARLNGDFAFGLFDPARKQLLLARDAIGVRPLYYYASRSLFLFASEIKTLLSHPEVETRPNDDVLASFLLTRFAGEGAQAATFFQDIVSVLPAHRVVVKGPDAVRTQRYWDFDLAREIRFAHIDDYAGAFRQHFEQAVRRRLRTATPVAVSVSGGLDSSAIFCVGETLRRSAPACYPTLLGVSQIFPDGSASDERSFLIEIERAYGVRLERLEGFPAGITDYSEEAIWRVEAPFLDVQWNRTQAGFAAVRQLGANVVLTGHWGDQMLFDDAYLVDLVQRGAWRDAWRHLNEYSQWVDVPSRHFRHRLGVALIKRYLPGAAVRALRVIRDCLRTPTDLQPWYTETFRRRAHSNRADRPNQPAASSAHGQSLYREARSRYHVLCMEVNNKAAAMHGLEIAFPFLDRDLLAFLMAIPGEVQSWKGRYKGLLREALRGALPEAIAGRAAKADFTDVVNALAGNRNRVLRVFQARQMVTALGYVHAQGLSHLARREPQIAGSTCEVSWALNDLLSLELWLRRFFGSRSPHVEMEVF